MRAGTVALDRERLSNILASRKPFVLNLFPDARFAAVVADARRMSPTSWFVYATLAGGGYATLFTGGGVFRGEVHSPDGVYALKSAGSSDRVTIIEMDSTQSIHDDHRSREPLGIRGPRPGGLPAAIAEDHGAETDGDAGPDETVDLLAVYMPTAEADEGGRTQTEAMIVALVETVNQALADSGLGHRRIRLVATVGIGHALSEAVARQTFSDRKGRSVADRTGILDEVFELRERHGADMVHLFMGLAGELRLGCSGAGGIYGLYGRGWVEYICSSDEERTSFDIDAEECLSTVQRWFWRDRSWSYSGLSCPGILLTHELGHNFGIFHDRYVARASLADPVSFPFRPYGFGYVNQNFDRPQCHRTVMSYPDQCRDEYDSGGVPHLMFSGPNLELGSAVDGTDPAGVPGEEATVDLDGPADAARAIDDVWDLVANLYSKTESGHDVPFMPAAGDGRRQGIVRLVNHSPQAGEVAIRAFDDGGGTHGPFTLAIGAYETLDFNSDDLETGNPAHGLPGIGAGAGDWRLNVTSLLDIEVLAYVRSGDGFVAAVHDQMPPSGPGRRAAFFNPGSDQDQISMVRLINVHHAKEAEVLVTATDDGGVEGGEVRILIPPRAARTFTAKELEEGGVDFEGALGDGVGRWRLFVETVLDLAEVRGLWNPPEARARVMAMSLVEDSTGRLANLSTVPRIENQGPHAIPLFPAGTTSERQGFARVVNRTGEAAEARIVVFDDDGRRYGPSTLLLDAGATVHLDADDLQNGNPAKGLSGGIGAGRGDWRLELTSDSRIEVLGYVRTGNGFPTAMHDVAPSRMHTHRIAAFDPAVQGERAGRLRLVNPGDNDAEATVTGVGANGVPSHSALLITVPARASRTFTAQELESGGSGFEGLLGDGAGAWQLTVEADREIVAMGLAETGSGHLVNLSTSPVRGVGPWPPPERDPSGTASAFEDRILDAGGAPLDVDLAAAFAGSGWEFSAASSDDSVAEASVSDDGTLTVRQTGVGMARITVEAVGPGGTRLVRTLVVRVRPPDDGDDAEGSTLMQIGPPLAANIDDASDTDVFRIDLQGSATLEVRTSGPTDTRGELLDSAGARIASDDDSGPGGHNFLVRTDLDAGIYYVAVRGESGDYAVMARLGDAHDHGGTAAAATLLTLYAETDLDRVSPSALLAAPGKIAPTDADVDVFRLDVPRNGTEVTIRSAGGTNVVGRLFDASGNEIAVDAGDGNFRIEARLDAGTYYVEVTGRDTGTYRVLAWAAPASCPCAAAPTSDHGGGAESSTLMPIGPPVPGTITGASDVDLFRIDLQGSATLEVRTSGPTDTRGELLDSAGSVLASDDDSGPAGHNFLVRADLQAGVYYVAVTGEPGDYAVLARLGDAPDHGGTEATATLLTLYAEEDLDRVSPSALLAAPGKIAPTAADVDVFRLDVSHDATDVTVQSAGGTDVFARLLDSSLNEIAADASGGNFRIEAQLDAGVHYVVVGGSETGTYRVLAWADPQPCDCDDGR